MPLISSYRLKPPTNKGMTASGFLSSSAVANFIAASFRVSVLGMSFKAV
jgi:hypothetical protein